MLITVVAHLSLKTVSFNTPSFGNWAVFISYSLTANPLENISTHLPN